VSLELDARQRAMLQDMGITVWQPKPTALLPPAAAAPAVPTRIATPRLSLSVSLPVAPPASVQPLWNASDVLYPQIEATSIPPELGMCWLLLLEGNAAEQPLSGNAGQLLHNMLRAMRLHHHPRVFTATLAPGNAATSEAMQSLGQILEKVQPSIVLALGRNAAHAALARTEPLGTLRQTSHRLSNGTPVVVSYAPAYLLRALPEAKAAAWNDLCRALEIVHTSATIKG